jgi:type IV pilus assembly protein PilA
MRADTLRARLDRDDGFTLIELMVVVLIIGILLAIALPTFLGARNRAQDVAAKSTVREAFTAGRVVFSTNESYVSADLTGALQSVDNSIGWVGATPSSEPTEVSSDNPLGVLILAAYSKAGNCFYLKDDPPNDTRYWVRSDGVTCDATDLTGAAWVPSW